MDIVSLNFGVVSCYYYYYYYCYYVFVFVFLLVLELNIAGLKKCDAEQLVPGGIQANGQSFPK